jgi:hypothetical protein
MKLLPIYAGLIASASAVTPNQLVQLEAKFAEASDNVGVPSLRIAIEAVKTAIANAEADGNPIEALVKADCEGDACQTGTLNLEPLFGYGCWCFFGRIDSALGRGPPVDAYDATCQKLALCYRCIFVDSENDGEDCDPFTTEFSATISMNQLLGGGAASNASTTCITQNAENCSWRTCSCAMTMITSFFNLSFDSSNPYDDNLKHANGFDYNLECPQQGRAQDRQCCGFYPSRRTFDRHEARECCHDISIYNPLRHICCPDGSHMGLGHSC